MRNILRNIFLEKLCTKCVEKTSLRLFSNKLKMSISLDKQSEFLYILLLLLVQFEDYQNISKLMWADHLVLLQIRPFYKSERGLKLVSLTYFLHDF